MRAVEVRVDRGRVTVAGSPVGDGPDARSWGLPADLVGALQEWARVATALREGARDAGDAAGDDGVAVSRRGRHLAARVSVVLRVPVDYVDPVTGWTVALRAVTGVARGTERAGAPTAAGEGAEPVPWGPGLAVAAVVAGLVLVANVALAQGLVAGLGLIGVVLDVLVIAGLVPALWMNRHAPTWRWAVLGSFAGMALAVPALVVQALG